MSSSVEDNQKYEMSPVFCIKILYCYHYRYCIYENTNKKKLLFSPIAIGIFQLEVPSSEFKGKQE